MADVNHVIIIGRLVNDAILKYTSGGMAIANLSLAVNRRVKKGEQIAVEGEIKQERWEQDGQARSKVVIIADSVQLDGFYIGEETDKMRVKQNFIYDLFLTSIFDGRIDYFKVKDKFAVIGVNYHHEYDYDYKESEMHEGVFSDAVKILEFAEGLSK